MQSKHLWRIVGWQTVDVIDEALEALGPGHLVSLVELKGIGEQLLTEPHRGEGGQQAFVEVVGDPTAVLHLANHVDQGLPRYPLLGVHLVQVVLDKLDAGGKIGLVELVGYVPAQRAELAAFLDDGVQEGYCVEEWGPL